MIDLEIGLLLLFTIFRNIRFWYFHECLLSKQNECWLLFVIPYSRKLMIVFQCIIFVFVYYLSIYHIIHVKSTVIILPRYSVNA